MRLWLSVLAIPLTCCSSPTFDQNNIASDESARECLTGLSHRGCVGLSVDVIGLVARDELVGLIQRSNGKPSGEPFSVQGLNYDSGAYIRVRGVIQDFQEGVPIVLPDSVQLSQLSKRLAPVSSQSIGTSILEIDEGNYFDTSTSELSPEAQIARNKASGLKALEEADTAIRANNAQLLESLEAKSLKHHVTNGGNIKVDVFQMPDGRYISCTTKVYDSGAPITTCDGEP